MKQALVLLMMLTLSIGCDKKKPDEPEKPTDTSEKKTAENNEAPEKTDTTETKNPASLQNVIYFEFDSSDLGESARGDLEKNAEWLREDGQRTLRIEGHTDETGTAEYNLGLGQRRAKSTKDYLVRLGIAPERIKIITYGEEKPAGTEDSKNRRSVFIATKK